MSNSMNDPDYLQNFGQKLRTLRQRKGLTLQALGDMLDVSHQFISKLEQGKKYPHAVILVKLSQIFNVSVDVLVKDELEL